MFRKLHRWLRLPLLTLLLGAVIFAFGPGCALNPDDEGDNGDGNGNGNGGGGEVVIPTTPRILVEDYIPDVYSKMDSIAYESVLDSLYIFELLDEDPEDGEPPEWWNRDEELRIAGNMFNARYNDDGQSVQRIDLKLSPRSVVVDNTTYPPDIKPPDQTWWKVETFVDLLVVVDDPVEAINFVVLSDQIFTTMPDREVDTLWALYKQVDQEPIN